MAYRKPRLRKTQCWPNVYFLAIGLSSPRAKRSLLNFCLLCSCSKPEGNFSSRGSSLTRKLLCPLMGHGEQIGHASLFSGLAKALCACSEAPFTNFLAESGLDQQFIKRDVVQERVRKEFSSCSTRTRDLIN